MGYGDVENTNEEIGSSSKRMMYVAYVVVSIMNGSAEHGD